MDVMNRHPREKIRFDASLDILNRTFWSCSALFSLYARKGNSKGGSLITVKYVREVGYTYNHRIVHLDDHCSTDRTNATS